MSEEQKKQTVVDFINILLINRGYAGVLSEDDIEEAKQMHKEEVFDAYETSHISMMTAEQYYDENYGK